MAAKLETTTDELNVALHGSALGGIGWKVELYLLDAALFSFVVKFSAVIDPTLSALKKSLCFFSPVVSVVRLVSQQTPPLHYCEF